MNSSETGQNPLPDFLQQRKKMVQQHLCQRDIDDESVLRAMLTVERHRFVRPENLYEAYADKPLPIGFGQTISQPYIVALMTQLARPTQSDRALEIGTGCGYQTAVLASLVKEVFSIETVETLARESHQRLAELGIRNATVRHGNGFRGWPERAPFDIILVTAAPQRLPQPLLDQLAIGGRLVIPIGKEAQHLQLIIKMPNGQVVEMIVADVKFVPMIGADAV